MNHRLALRDYYKQWLERHKQASEIAPAVNDALCQVEWELAALADLPDEAKNISTTQLDDQAAEMYSEVESILPMMPEYPRVITFQVNSISTSSSTGVTTFVSHVGHLGTPEATNYASRHLAAYERLQEAQCRPAVVRTAIEELFTGDTLARFDAANTAMHQSVTGLGTESAAAMEMRTLLDGIQGQLYVAAGRQPQQSMNWESMARLLFKHPSESAMLNQLLAQGPVRSQLVDELSNIGKRRTGARSIDLRSVWLRTLDHVFIVLSLLKVRRATANG